MSLWEGETASGDIWGYAEGQAEQGGIQLLRLLLGWPFGVPFATEGDPSPDLGGSRLPLSCADLQL